jgi:hypothetical protein
MVQSGPYGPNHATAATFAFRKELLLQTKFEEEACIAEEKNFLKNYTIPFVQLDTMKTILVFSHIHNSFDKKELLKVFPTPFANYSDKKPEDFVKDVNMLNFFMKDIDNLLDKYDLGDPKHKPDVIKQMEEIKIKREIMEKKQMEQMQFLNKINNHNNPNIPNIQNIQNKEQQSFQIIQNLILENNALKEKVKYLEDKMSQLIKVKIEKKIEDKKL